MRLLSCLIFCLLSFRALSQTNSLSGIINDGDTGEPVPFANVFLANTLIGTSSNEDGTFTLNNIPNGKYDLTISMVGYELLSVPVYISSQNVKLKIQLKQDATLLNDIVIRPHKTDFDKYYGTFKNLFLGTTPNSSQCRIKNPEDIYLDYNTETKILKASASKPIEIENRALGYTVFYLLSEFELDNNKHLYKVFGVPRFVSLDPKGEHQLRMWTRNRSSTYRGSLDHLMRSLLNRELKVNKFSVFDVSNNNEILIKEEVLFESDSSNQVNFKGDMKIIYDGVPENGNYSTMARLGNRQTSILHFLQPPTIIYDNGYFENKKAVVLDGYMAWRECVGNLLPNGYQPN